MEAPPDSGLERSLRRWRIAAWVGGSLLLGPVLGLIAMVAGMQLTFRRIEAMKAPTPGDLTAGIWAAAFAPILGLVAGAVGAALLVLALVRQDRLRRAASETSHAGEPWR